MKLFVRLLWVMYCLQRDVLCTPEFVSRKLGVSLRSSQRYVSLARMVQGRIGPVRIHLKHPSLLDELIEEIGCESS
jgi:hypothetical protein